MLDIVILAAGKGSRMRSDKPKVLHTVAGVSMLEHVVSVAESLDPRSITIVVGHGAELVKSEFKDRNVQFALQQDQLGTGHAVLQAMPYIGDDGRVVVLYGDVPLLRADTVQPLLEDTNPLTLLTAKLDNPAGYGRIIREESSITAIIEQKDASPAQLAVTEVNTGILAVAADKLKRWLPLLSDDNAQAEYYLTDLVAIAHQTKELIGGHIVADTDEILGANDRKQLAQLERLFQARLVDQLMADGATVLDPSRVDIHGKLTVGKDVTIEPNVVFKGNVTLGDGVTVEANSIVIDSTIAAGTTIFSHSRIESSTIGENAAIGPYARLRPGSQLANNTKIGNFVETKKAVIGEGSKVNHLSYVGDATLGEGVNVGAGTITCNYDGKNKHQTVIGDGCFVGSNSALVAPITISDNVLVAAGSTLTKNVPANSLAVARSRQSNREGFVKK